MSAEQPGGRIREHSGEWILGFIDALDNIDPLNVGDPDYFRGYRAGQKKRRAIVAASPDLARRAEEGVG